VSTAVQIWPPGCGWNLTPLVRSCGRRLVG